MINALQTSTEKRKFEEAPSEVVATPSEVVATPGESGIQTKPTSQYMSLAEKLKKQNQPTLFHHGN